MWLPACAGKRTYCHGRTAASPRVESDNTIGAAAFLTRSDVAISQEETSRGQPLRPAPQGGASGASGTGGRRNLSTVSRGLSEARGSYVAVRRPLVLPLPDITSPDTNSGHILASKMGVGNRGSWSQTRTYTRPMGHPAHGSFTSLSVPFAGAPA